MYFISIKYLKEKGDNMLKSMTGFGRAVEEIDGYVITVEIKSVNHRYFDFSSRIPRQYGFLDDKLKSYINSRVSRGKVECYVSVEALDTEDAAVVINKTLASAYVKALKELSEEYSLKEDFGTAFVSRLPDVFVLKKADEDEEKIWQLVKSVTDEAIEKFIQMRAVEGAKMKEDVASRAEYILDCVSFIEERSPQTVKEYNDKLVERVHEIIGDVSLDEQRIIQEVAIYADKVAVAEETVRLRSHIAQLKTFLESEEPIGRKMDFLVQEINRETNTIGSKANDVDIARKVVDIKAEVEKIREQIQNIE
jgi:TIGR00255 family protein